MKQTKEKSSRLKNTKHKPFFFALVLGLTIVSFVGLGNSWLSNRLLVEAAPDNNSLPDDLSLLSNTLLVEAAPDNNSLPDDLSLPPIHPDEPAEYTFHERLSTTNALNRTSQIRNALSSFQKLTTKAQTVLEKEALNEVGNTGWDIQNLGFPNWVDTAEGTIRKQDYQIKKLELELAQKQYEAGEIEQAVLDSKVESYETAKQNFQQFWQSLTIRD